MAEYSFGMLQTVAEDENVLFLDGERACHKGYVAHRQGGGLFRLKGANKCGNTIYRVTFNANIAAAEDGGTIPDDGVRIALQEDGETLQNAVAIVTPAAVGDFFNVSLSTFIVIPCGCCVTISVENISDGTAIDVSNANIIIDRVA